MLNTTMTRAQRKAQEAKNARIAFEGSKVLVSWGLKDKKGAPLDPKGYPYFSYLEKKGLLDLVGDTPETSFVTTKQISDRLSKHHELAEEAAASIKSADFVRIQKQEKDNCFGQPYFLYKGEAKLSLYDLGVPNENGVAICSEPEFLGKWQIWLDKSVPKLSDWLERGQGILNDYLGLPEKAGLAMSCLMSKREDLGFNDQYFFHFLDIMEEARESGNWDNIKYCKENEQYKDALEKIMKGGHAKEYYVTCAVERAINSGNQQKTEPVFYSRENGLPTYLPYSTAVDIMDKTEGIKDWTKMSKLYPLLKKEIINFEEFVELSAINEVEFPEDEDEYQAVVEAAANRFIDFMKQQENLKDMEDGINIPKPFRSFTPIVGGLKLKISDKDSIKVENIEKFFQLSKKVGIFTVEEFNKYNDYNTKGVKTVCTNPHHKIREDWEKPYNKGSSIEQELLTKEFVMLTAIRKAVNPNHGGNADLGGQLCRTKGNLFHVTGGEHIDTEWGVMQNPETGKFEGKNKYGELLMFARSELLKQQNKEVPYYIPKFLEARKKAAEEKEKAEVQRTEAKKEVIRNFVYKR